MNNIAIAIHGGAGTILKSAMDLEKEVQYKKALNKAITLGHSILKAGGTALEAVEKAVVSLEDEPLFNAGKGSVFNNLGQHEMDAAIMCGKDLTAGAVAGIGKVRNPILVAKCIRLLSEHVFLTGAGAETFAREQNLVFEESEYFFDAFRHEQYRQAQLENTIRLDHSQDRKFGTVGAVALDSQGNLAAATSTGGMTNKKYNRIGDSPIIGAGTYANNATCAVSATGYGEYFIRAVVAYDISCLMQYKGFTLQQACEEVIKFKLVKLGGEGGVIAVDGKGTVSLCFNSEGMYRASVYNDEPILTAIYAD